MNLCITNVCNRRCEYCFQKEWFLANSKEEIQEMSLKDVEAILKWFNYKHFKILGGEPLLYSDLDSFFELIEKYNKQISIISNISIDHDKFKYIVDKYENKKFIDGWLVNTDYPKYQEEFFLKNIKYLIEKGKSNITLSTTLLPDKDKIKKSSDRLKKILKFCRIGKKRIGIRVSPFEPNHINKIEKYNFTLDVYDIYLRINRIISNTPFSFDCPVNACELDYQFYENRGANISFDGTKCLKNMPFDILPDKSAIWCSSANFFKIDNIFNYSNIKECKKELKRQYKEYWNQNKILCNFENCEKNNYCRGLCPAKNEAMKNKGKEIGVIN